MKIAKVTITFFGAALLCASSLLAGGTNKGTIDVADKITVEGKTINPGSYRVRWSGDGPSVQVSLLQGKNTVATFPALVKEDAPDNTNGAYGLITGPDGSQALSAIYIGGKHHTVLEVQQTGASQ
jgi:hypothetical protein